MPDNKQVQQVAVPVEWNVPDNIQSRYATNIIIQRMENEFMISFFEVRPPIILGRPDEIVEKLKQFESIRATCVAQIIVAANKMPGVLKAFQDILQSTNPDVDTEAKE